MRRLPRLFSPLFSPLIAAIAAATACTSPDSGTIQIVVGDQGNALATSTKLEIDSVDTSGTPTVLATASLPASTIDLGSQSESAGEVALEVKGTNAQGALVAFGASLPLLYASLPGETVPILVQRVGQFAGMPGPLTDSRQAPLLSVVQGQYLFLSGGLLPPAAADGGASPACPVDGGAQAPTTTTQLYDFSQLAPLGSPPSLPSAPQSVAFVGTVGWMINAAGGTYYDLSSDSSLAITAPAGAAFSDVAGGTTVTDDSGALYVVGATRTTGAATPWVLKIDPNDTSNTNYPYGNPTWLQLKDARLGAAAAWVSGRGLVVAGGSAAGSGVEVIGTTSTMGSELPYPVDPSVGAGAATLDSQHVLLAGGLLPDGTDAGVRSIDLGCTVCAASVWSSLPVALGGAQVFTFSPTDGLIVGSEPGSGVSHAFRLSASGGTGTDGGAGSAGSATVVTLPALPTSADGGPAPGDAGCGALAALVNARAVWSPVGSVVVVGGTSTIESFRIAP